MTNWNILSHASEVDQLSKNWRRLLTSPSQLMKPPERWHPSRTSFFVFVASKTFKYLLHTLWRHTMTFRRCDITVGHQITSCVIKVNYCLTYCITSCFSLLGISWVVCFCGVSCLPIFPPLHRFLVSLDGFVSLQYPCIMKCWICNSLEAECSLHFGQIYGIHCNGFVTSFRHYTWSEKKAHDGLLKSAHEA